MKSNTKTLVLHFRMVLADQHWERVERAERSYFRRVMRWVRELFS